MSYRFKSHHSFQVHKHTVAQGMIDAFVRPENKLKSQLKILLNTFKKNLTQRK
jgi:hypothetical protein